MSRNTTIVRVTRRNLARPMVSDLYHLLHRSSWSVLVLVTIFTYMCSNALFAGLYLLDPGCIANARPDSYADAFFFSVQTMSTIGFGTLSPLGTWANVLVACEAIYGVIFSAMVTGMFFAKFSVPRARVRFASVAVVAEVEGAPTLMIRMANERDNQIVEATCRLTIAKQETLPHGEVVRRFYDVPLRREESPVFAVSWTIYHRLDADSPIGSAEELAQSDAWLFLSVSGVDEQLSSRIYARCFYRPEQIRWNERYVDVLDVDSSGGLTIDYAQFDDTHPA